MAKHMTGAEMVVEALKDQGVEMVFGYPGGAVLPIYDAIFHQNKLRPWNWCNPCSISRQPKPASLVVLRWARPRKTSLPMLASH